LKDVQRLSQCKTTSGHERTGVHTRTRTHRMIADLRVIGDQYDALLFFVVEDMEHLFQN
jgi:hypothetical protein